MTRKAIAGKAAFLATIHHPGTAMCTLDDPEAHQLVAWFSSYLANATIDDNDNTDLLDDIILSEARNHIAQTFNAILIAERTTSESCRTNLESAYRCGSVSLCRYLAHRARLWAGSKVARSLISDIKSAHLRDMERELESLRKHMARQNMLTTEGYDPSGDQEDHINTHYNAGSGSNTYRFSC